MTIKSKSEMRPGLEIDLSGPEGNAFVLMGYAKRLARQLGMDGVEASNIINDMQSGDYEHLLEVFEENFGEFVTLYR